MRGCYYCNPRKERRREAKKEVLRLKILATKERLRYLAETYKEEMKKHIKRVTKLGRQTGYMQVGIQAGRTAGEWERTDSRFVSSLSLRRSRTRRGRRWVFWRTSSGCSAGSPGRSSKTS